jgi:hypothetical protein
VIGAKCEKKKASVVTVRSICPADDVHESRAQLRFSFVTRGHIALCDPRGGRRVSVVHGVLRNLKRKKQRWGKKSLKYDMSTNAKSSFVPAKHTCKGSGARHDNMGVVAELDNGWTLMF